MKGLSLLTTIAIFTLLTGITLIIVGYTNRYANVVLYADSQILPLKTDKLTVNELLKSKRIKLSNLDIVRPGLETRIKEGMIIRVYHLNRKQDIRHEVLPSPVQIRFSSHLLTGQSQVKQKGRDGLRRLIMETISLDGRIIRSLELGSSILRLAIPTIILKGTGRHIQGFPISSIKRIKRIMTMRATAYSDSSSSCGKWAGARTSIGLKPRQGIIAVDPRVIPLKTRLYVEGYGHGIAGDVGGAIKGKKIDLCFNTHQEAVRYGHKTVKVYVLE